MVGPGRLCRSVVIGGLWGASCMSGDRKVDAYYAAMQADLRALVRSQNTYYDGHGYYANSLGVLDFTRSGGVEVQMMRGDSTAWRVVVTHQGLETRCDYTAVGPPVDVPTSREIRNHCANPP